MIGNRSSATPVKKAGEAAPEGRSAAEQSAPRTCGRGDAVPSLQGFEAEGFASLGFVNAIEAQQCPDEELVRRLAEGQREALDPLHERYAPVLTSLAA